MIKITIYNTKGGVGKTSLAVNLASAISRQGFRTLLIDNEPQADVTVWTSSFSHTEFLEDYYRKELFGEEYVVTPHVSDVFGIDIIPCTAHLVDIETLLSNKSSIRNSIMARILEKVTDNYDYVIIDNMPTLSFLVINSFVASDYIIIPTQPSYLSASRIKDVVRYVNRINDGPNPNLSVLGVSIQMVEKRTVFGRGMVNSIRKSYQDVNVFNTLIPFSVRVPESTFYHTSVYGHKQAGKIAASFDQLAKEVIGYAK